MRFQALNTGIFLALAVVAPLNTFAAIPSNYYLIAIGTTAGSTIGNADDTASGASACTLRDASEIVTAGTTAGPVTGCDITAIGAPDAANPVYVINYPPGLTYTIDMIALRDELGIAFHPVHIVGTDPANDIVQGDKTRPLGLGSRMFNFFQSDSTISNLTLRYGDGRGREGGTLINSAGELTLENVRIYGTQSTAAGAGLANTTNGVMNITAGSVIGDQTEQNEIVGSIGAFGGAGILNWNSTLLITDSTVHYNTTNELRDGGGIYSTFGASLTVIDSTIAHNSLTNVLGQDGAGIYSRGELNVEGGHIHSNSTLGDGGGIYAEAGSQLTVSGDAVIGGTGTPNDASEGGGIYILSFPALETVVSISGAQISHNTTARGGGGIFNSQGRLNIGDASTDTVISHNVAGSINGGGIHNAGGTLNMTHSTVSENQALGGFGFGGGIYNGPAFVGGSAAPQLHINSSLIDANDSRVGGGIHNGGQGAVTMLDDTRVTNNTSTGAGGGILNQLEGRLIVRNGSVIGAMDAGNRSGFRGGGIFNLGGDAIISDSEVSHNSSTDADGGGIYSGARETIEGDTELPALLMLDNSRVVANQAKLGALFSPNGGGIYHEDGTLIMMDSVVLGNSAAGSGGGLANRDGRVSILGGAINGNLSEIDGGGLFNQTEFGFGDTASITDILRTTMLDNSAMGNGGAIYNEVTIFRKTATVTINDSRIGEAGNGNQATLGGAIYNVSDPFFDPAVALVTVVGSYLESNSSGIYHSDGTTRVNYSCIEGNGSGFFNNSPDTVQNARDNWWGADDGPSDLGGSTASGSGDGVSDGVDFSGFSTRGCAIDATGGFVTGGGWFDSPAGAYTAEPDLTGKATFGFVAKYVKSKDLPVGNTQFQFRAAGINFKSSGYDWLRVAGARAMFKGVGTVNGSGNFGFMLTAIDEALTPSTDSDLFRMKIWDRDTNDTVIYDNGLGADNSADPSTMIGGGSIVIHTTKQK